MNKKIKDIIGNIRQIIESERLAGVNELFGKKSNRMPLLEFKKCVFSCQKCALSETRRNVVFGEGNTRAKLMFVGEAPGAEEDKEARPFVGKAGELLTKIIEAMGLKREDVFIANILKCRPPNNRPPLPNEIAACYPYLKKQILFIKPKVICALGRFAAGTLLNTEIPISKLRGKFYNYKDIKLMPTYHPAYLLRNPEDKKDVWKDMQLIVRELGPMALRVVNNKG